MRDGDQRGTLEVPPVARRVCTMAIVVIAAAVAVVVVIVDIVIDDGLIVGSVEIVYVVHSAK